MVGIAPRLRSHLVDVVSESYPEVSTKIMRDLSVVLIVDRIFLFSINIKTYLLSGRGSLPMGKQGKPSGIPI